jgi:hypothetical protein
MPLLLNPDFGGKRQIHCAEDKRGVRCGNRGQTGIPATGVRDESNFLIAEVSSGRSIVRVAGVWQSTKREWTFELNCKLEVAHKR